jgi:transposase-like protein
MLRVKIVVKEITAMNTYTAEFKEAIVQKWYSGKHESFAQFARSHNLPESTVAKWLPRSVNSSSVHRSLTWLGKATMLHEWRNLPEHDRGAWLRQTGLMDDELALWESEVGMNQQQELLAAQKELQQLKKINAKLEKDLAVKDRTLADITARWMMLKKKQELFGENEDD